MKNLLGPSNVCFGGECAPAVIFALVLQTPNVVYVAKLTLYKVMDLA